MLVSHQNHGSFVMRDSCKHNTVITRLPTVYSSLHCHLSSITLIVSSNRPVCQGTYLMAVLELVEHSL